MPDEVLLKSTKIKTYDKRWLEWNPESGYHHLPSPHLHPLELLEQHEHLPRRSISPGLFSGLSVVLNLNHSEHFCTSTSAIGLRVRYFQTLFPAIFQYLGTTD